MSYAGQKINIKGREFDYNPQKLDRNTEKKLDLEIAKSNLLLFNKIAQTQNFRFVLFFGTLLGAIREKNFIKNDSDIDVVTSDEDGLLNIIPELQKEDFLFIRYYTSSTRTVYSFSKDDVYIDIYLARKAGKNKYFLEGAKIPTSFVEEFTTMDFLGESFAIPVEYEKILVMLYGNDWRIPQNKEGFFPVFLRRDYDQILIHMIPKSFRNFIKKILGIKR